MSSVFTVEFELRSSSLQSVGEAEVEECRRVCSVAALAAERTTETAEQQAGSAGIGCIK